MNTPSTPPIQLSCEQLQQYNRDGFIVVEDLVSASEIHALQDRLREYTHGGRSQGHIQLQIEPRVQRGELEVDHPGDSIRKIDGLVESDEVYRRLALHDNLAGIIAQILGPDLKLFRNSVLLKPPAVGSAKGMHQDSPYWPIRPMDLCSCWFAIDDATLENGCMGAIPSDQTRGKLQHDHVTDDYVIPDELVDASRKELCPMKAGSGLFFHSLVPHATEPNRSTQWRRAIALSYMRSTSTHTDDDGGPEYFHVRGKTYPGCVR